MAEDEEVDDELLSLKIIVQMAIIVAAIMITHVGRNQFKNLLPEK